MPSRLVDRLRAAVASGDYDVTRHAVEEMAEDGLLLADVEHAVINGRVTRRETDDRRGTRYTLTGPSEDGREVGVVGRFTETGVFLIVTVYEIGAGASG